jgi:hypothetical protein
VQVVIELCAGLGGPRDADVVRGTGVILHGCVHRVSVDAERPRVGAHVVLDAAVPGLLTDTDAVGLVLQMAVGRRGKIKGGQTAIKAIVVLKTSLRWSERNSNYFEVADRHRNI